MGKSRYFRKKLDLNVWKGFNVWKVSQLRFSRKFLQNERKEIIASSNVYVIVDNNLKMFLVI